MSILLIDIGNSRIKWHFDSSTDRTNVLGALEPHALSHHATDWLDELRHAWQNNSPPVECRISSVASDATLSAVKQLIAELYPHAEIHSIRAQASHTVLTLNYEVAQMGADRYAQLLGAQFVCPNNNHIVISAGTATTIDGVFEGGQHIGGMILPSVALMRKSLHQYTAKLPLEGGQLQTDHAPRNAADALASAAHWATLGAIREFSMRYMRGTRYDVVLCGGDGQRIAETLQLDDMEHIHIVPSLCLLGLKIWQPNEGIVTVQ